MRIRNLIALSLLGVMLIVILAFVFAARPVNDDRTYVIGWAASPPDEVPTKSGEPTGFSVELVREAATRRRIRLKWVEHPESSEAALRRKAVDLWPMMIITEERKKFFYLTDPYQEDEFALYVNEKSAFMKATDFKGHTISSEGIPIDLKLLREYFPESLHLPKASLAEAIRSVCDGEAQAFFDDRLTMFAFLLKNHPPCLSTSFRMIPIQNLKVELAIGATRESRGAADVIRDEIGVMGRDGSLEKIVSAWSPAASQELLTLTKLQQSKNHLREYRLGLASVVTLFVFALCSAAGYRRQRIKAHAYSQALGAAERNVRLVADSLTEMVVAFDTQKKLTYANSGAEALTGYGLGELRAGTLLSWVHPEDRPHVWELWGKAFNDQAAEQVVHRLITKDGAVKWVAGTWGPLVDETGHCVGIRGTCQDITERVLTERLLEETTQKFRTIVEEIAERERAEAALRESEERFRNMADTAPVMIWVSGPDKLCTFFNKVWLEFTGRTMEQELGSGWAVGVHPDDVNRCVGTYFTSFDARRSFQMEYRLLRADGKYRWVLDNGVPRFEPGGVFAGYIGSCLDITEIKRTLEASLASQKLETVGQLAGGIAHDFNNILGGVLFQADVALEELTGGNSPETELQGIRECAIRGAEIVRQLMFYSGKESDTSELVDVSRIVEEMLNLLRVSISKRATVATDLGKSLPSLRANPSQVRQIVMNLITNASEAIGDREGVIRIKTSRVTVSPDRFQTATEHLEAGDFLRLDVSDTGCGIPLEAQARVFDPFFTTKADGRGLGLAVVHGIVGGLGGTICLESEVGKGTTFQITMPCAEVRVTETNGQISSHGQRLSVSQGTILVVEDEDPIRRPVSKILQKTGFNVIEAADGYAALEMIRSPQKDIDILLLDVTLPGAPSREVYEEAMRLRPEMKIIVASAYSEEMAATALSEKVELFIRKPYGLGDLMDLIQQSLAWNHSRPTPRDDAEIGRKEQC